MSKLPLSFCIFVKNEEDNISYCLSGVQRYVAEIVVVDTGSTDRTVEIAKKFTDRVYQVPFTDFGSIRTLTAHLADYPWVLMLDADERFAAEDWKKVAMLISQPPGVRGDDMELDRFGDVVVDSWALPRIRWADKEMKQQVDVESYPDWQVRLFRNHTNRKKIRYRRRVHETVCNCVRTEHAAGGPTIHHFQNVTKDAEALKAREDLYRRLYEADIAEGVEHSEPVVIEEDKVD